MTTPSDSTEDSIKDPETNPDRNPGPITNQSKELDQPSISNPDRPLDQPSINWPAIDLDPYLSNHSTSTCSPTDAATIRQTLDHLEKKGRISMTPAVATIPTTRISKDGHTRVVVDLKRLRKLAKKNREVPPETERNFVVFENGGQGGAERVLRMLEWRTRKRR